MSDPALSAPGFASPITLADVAARRVWCPASGRRSGDDGDSFAAKACCLGPRCAVWLWRSADDAEETETRLRHLLPAHFTAAHRLRLASRLMPALVAPLQVLAAADSDAPARAAAHDALLAWAGSDWWPEADEPDPVGWRRRAPPFWDEEAATPALILVRAAGCVRPPEQRAGFCGLRGR
jgi:hypothetical protein